MTASNTQNSESTRKINKKYNPAVLNFTHRKLNKKSKDYRHEIHHLTADLIDINTRIQKFLAECEYLINCIATQESNPHIVIKKEDFICFEDLLYHVENFIFRLHAYRDKMYMFINYALRVGYAENDTQLGSHLLKNDIIRIRHIDTELQRFNKGVISTLISKRKLMSHRIYYDSGTYNKLLMPKVTPKEVGMKRATTEWKKNVRLEANQAGKAVKLVMEINTRITEKILKALG